MEKSGKVNAALHKTSEPVKCNLRKIKLSTMQKQLSTSGFENSRTHYVIRQLLLLAIVCELLIPAQSMDDMLWNKRTQKFESIASIPNFASLYNDDNESRVKDEYNFHGKDIRFGYYDIPKVITGNETEISGYIGEIWKTLAEYLNFTLKPILSKDEYIGWLVDNGTEFSPGLLRMVQLNQTDVAGRVESAPDRSIAAQLTLPLKKASVYIFLKATPKHITTWALLLFSKKVWFTILATYILLSICSYVFHATETEIRRQNISLSLLDYFFYNFGFLCTQSYNSRDTNNSSRIMVHSVAIFALLLNASFNALVIGYMTRTNVELPFNGIVSVMENTQYNVVAVKESSVHKGLEVAAIPNRSSKSPKKRYFAVDNITELYKTLCSKELVCAYLLDEETIQDGNFCDLQSIGPVGSINIVSGISWNYKNKQIIDYGLLKLYENGVLNKIQRSWHKQKVDENTREPEAIVLEQVYLVLLLLFGGMLTSIIILILEQITFHCKK